MSEKGVNRKRSKEERPIVAVFGASMAKPGDVHYAQGEMLGKLLIEAGYSVATGGYGGLMEAVSKGAALAIKAQQGCDAVIVGVTVPNLFLKRAGANEHVTKEVRATSLIERIHEITDNSVASIAMFGSLGTATELFCAWNLAGVSGFCDQKAKPVIAIGERWQRVVDFVANEISADRALVTTVKSAAEAVQQLQAQLNA